MSGEGPLRVLLVTEAASAGVGRHVLDLAEGLIERGCEVFLAHATRRQDDRFAERLAALPALGVERIDMRRAPHPRDLPALLHLRRVLRAGDFDIAHAHSSKAGALLRLAAWKWPRPVVYTPHCISTMNPDLSPVAAWIFGTIERRLARGTDAIIAVSLEEMAHLKAMGLSERVHHVPNGIAPPARALPAQAGLRRTLGLPLHESVIGFAGRLGPQKDPLLMISAFAALCRMRQGVHLAMVGEGPLEPDARREGHRLGVSDRASFLGYRAAESCMPAFDVFALTSRYEGLPYVLLEALACGLPIVSVPVGGASSAVENGVNGAITADRSPSALAAAMQRLLAAPAAERAAMSEASRRRAATFTVARMVDDTLALYRRLAGQSAPTPRAARHALSHAGL